MSAPKSYKRLLQIGGLSGVLAFVANLFSFFLPVGNIYGPYILTAAHQANMAQFLAQFHQNLAPLAETAGSALLFLAFLPLFLALYVSLKETNPSYALIGCVFGVLGG